VLRLDISKDVNRALILLITTVVFIVSGRGGVGKDSARSVLVHQSRKAQPVIDKCLGLIRQPGQG
jgi:hypothetical protein